MHNRSKTKLLERKVRRYIFSTSYRDKIRSETVCRVSRQDIMSLFNEPFQVSLLPEVEKGEVLVDSRGEGTFQEVILHERPGSQDFNENRVCQGRTG